MAAKRRDKKRSIANNVERVRLPKGLTREEAIRRARSRWKHDHRGFHYDPKTGVATAI
jgi:hypothetical protein